MAGVEFKTKELSLSIQKKLFSRMAKKNVVKHLIDDSSAQLLDHLHQLTKLYSIDARGKSIPLPKGSEKIVKHIIKIVIKIAILIVNEQFKESELNSAHDLQRLLRSTLMTVVSFHEVDFTYDQHYLVESFESCRNGLKQLIRPHLSDKSLGRVDIIFDYFTDGSFLDRFFAATEPADSLHSIKQTIIDDIGHLLERQRL